MWLEKTKMSKKNILSYLKVMRLDHYHKNIVVVAGMIALFKFQTTRVDLPFLFQLGGALLIVCLASSFSYIVNEMADREGDQYHPKKKFRPVASGVVKNNILLVIGGLLLLITLIISYYFYSPYFFATLLCFFVVSILYNIYPFRFKNIAYLDVFTESVNNPLRFMLGWFAAGVNYWPSSSILISIWCLGGFLMTAKRHAEYIFITNDQERLAYRKSYGVYTPEKLSTFMVLWLVLFNFSFGILIIRVEPATLVMFPFLALFFTWYWWLTHKQDSVVKEPERILEEKNFLIYSILLALVFTLVFLFGGNIPLFEDIHDRYIFPK